MVHLTKAFVITTIAIAPVFAVPIQLGQDDLQLLMARDPNFFKSMGRSFGKAFNGVKSVIKKAAPVINNIRGVVKKVAPLAAMIPGPVGAIGMVASAVARRDLEEALYGRAVQDELDARGYDVQLDLREVEGLEARDLSEALEDRDNIYTLTAREFVDAIEMKARSELSDELEARQLA
jgi:hypothetical protein